MTRTPFAYATSHEIDETVMELADGSHREVLLKKLEIADAGVKRPRSLVNPLREPAVYELLAGAGLGTPACFGTADGWLVLEKVDGIPLWQVGEIAHWANASRWLAKLHSHFAHRIPAPDQLLTYNRRYFDSCAARAQGRYAIRRFARAHQRAVEILIDLPVTLVHGEFYPSNVLVAGDRIAPVDWEMAGVGPGVLDLAALITGWAEPERAAMVAAYGHVQAEHLAAAEMHLAVQWLGWGEAWTPPPAHARDWLAELQKASEKLGL